ncbi:MAG: hypothetical protein M1818_000365 [Claussenomyces sp. TS43310]|nr:MAG: hypothetical protein M1818_000365 [Claussenomyces sp. TS43310]
MESLEMDRLNIFEYITLEDVKIFSNTYFASINSIFDIVDQEEFSNQAARCWATQSIDPGFQVVVCGVVALGSLFSTNSLFIREADIIEQARLILDSSFAHSKVLLSLDFVVGWILRAIYLRSTTGPHVSWVASSMAMHIAESIGLHQEMSETRTTQGPQSQNNVLSEAEINTRRRTFWVACSLNRLFSAQYGRTMVTLQNVGCRYPTITPDDAPDDFISLIRLLPDLCDATTIGTSSAITVLTDGILQLGNKAVHRLPLILLRADAIFCIYRKLRYIGVALSTTHTEVVLSVIRSALDAADSLALHFQQWWTIVGVPFHSICVLIALNTIESLDLMPRAMESLQNIAAIFNSHRLREALRTAQDLVKVAETRKRKELEGLQRCLNLNTAMTASTSPHIQSSEGTSNLPSFEWPTDFDLGFSYFLNTS